MKLTVKVLLIACSLLFYKGVCQNAAKNFYIIPGISASQLNAYDKKVFDSVLTVYHKTKADTSQMRLLEFLIEKCADQDIWPKYNDYMRNRAAKMLEKKDLNAEEKKVYKRVMATSFTNSGFLYISTGQDSLAEIDYNKCLSISKEIGDERAIGACYTNLGRIYRQKGDIARSLESYHSSLTIQEKIGDRMGESYSLHNLGTLHKLLGDIDKSVSYITKALKIRREINEIQGTANSLEALGSIELWNRNAPTKAREYYLEALRLRLQYFNFNRVAESYHAIGNSFREEKNLDSAIANFLYGIPYGIKTNNQGALGDIYSSLGSCYMEKGQLPKAFEYASRGYNISLDLKQPLRISNTARVMAEVLAKQNKNAEAFAYYKTHIKMRDSVTNSELKRTALSKQLKFEYDKKTLTDSLKNAEQRKLEHAIYEEEASRQKLILLCGGIAFLLMAFIAFISFRAYKQKKRSSLIIEAQKNEVELQKSLVEEKNKEITDSINYANRIQRSIIANKKILEENLKHCFVYFQPKDIVSGDFYWATEHNNKFYLACCDSTGHGVPGAFMSLLNIGYLSEAINEKNIEQPSKVFDYVRNKLVVNLGKDGQKDGFDGVLFCFDKSKGITSYAAANNSPIVIRNEQIMELPKDKMPVGKGETDMNFTHFTFDLKPSDTLYLYTDGFADQFGGPKGKKFKYKQLDELLCSITSYNSNEQIDKLQKEFHDWKGKLEQIDDVCVMGIRI